MSSISTPRPAVAGGEPPEERPDLLRRQLDRGPDVQQDAVPLQPAARLAVGLEAADALERRPEHALELGQRGDAPVGVAQRREVAHLREREQPLVLRVGARHAAEQVDVLGRRAAGPARTADSRASAGGGTSSGADRGAPRPRPGRRRRAEGERRHRRHAAAAPGVGDGDDDPVHGPRQRASARARAQLLGELVGPAARRRRARRSPRRRRRRRAPRPPRRRRRRSRPAARRAPRRRSRGWRRGPSWR